MPSIVCVEHDYKHHVRLKNFLTQSYDVSICSHVRNLNQISSTKKFDIGIIDLDANEPEDLESIRFFSGYLSAAPIIAISKNDEPDWIVKVIKAGASDFITKPYSGERIRSAVQRALEKAIPDKEQDFSAVNLKNEIDYLRRQQDICYDFNKIIAQSSVMQSVMNLAKKYSQTDSNILITGETGTGKSFLAGAIHFNSSRRHKPFVKINCANIPETLLESELFGHEKGAFTDAVKTRVGRFEQARGGTVFLDEIGEMSPALQSKLLQVVEEKVFQPLGGNKTIRCDIRIVVATNRDLSEMVNSGEFRQDLYFRINVLGLHLPRLKERHDCIEPLAYHLLGKISRDVRKSVNGFSPQAVQMMKEYSWPGNIREMSNVIERGVLLEKGPQIRLKNIHLDSMSIKPRSSAVQETETLKGLDEKKKSFILDALESNLWVQKQAARQLGISPRSLNYTIKKLGIKHWRWIKNKPD